MRNFAFAAIGVLLVGGIFIYTEWQKKKFTESLTNPPASGASPPESSDRERSSTVKVSPASEHQEMTEQPLGLAVCFMETYPPRAAPCLHCGE